MKTEKLNLNNLKVKSFVIGFENDTANTIKGGHATCIDDCDGGTGGGTGGRQSVYHNEPLCYITGSACPENY